MSISPFKSNPAFKHQTKMRKNRKQTKIFRWKVNFITDKTIVLHREFEKRPSRFVVAAFIQAGLSIWCHFLKCFMSKNFCFGFERFEYFRTSKTLFTKYFEVVINKLYFIIFTSIIMLNWIKKLINVIANKLFQRNITKLPNEGEFDEIIIWITSTRRF